MNPRGYLPGALYIGNNLQAAATFYSLNKGTGDFENKYLFGTYTPGSSGGYFHYTISQSNFSYEPDNINKVFDNLIRNSIDHRDYVYNYNIQLISFNNKSDERKMYLIEFSNNLFQGFLLANILWDILMYFAEEENILLSK